MAQLECNSPSIAVQFATSRTGVPHPARIREWVLAVLETERRQGGVCVRLVAAPESARLNRRYRARPGATNVLAFPGPPPAAGGVWLGDVVVCVPVAQREAREQGKAPGDHFAHLVVHGVLHLLGYDHKDSADADRMESCERRILARFAIPDPYRLERAELGRVTPAGAGWSTVRGTMDGTHSNSRRKPRLGDEGALSPIAPD